MALQRIALVTGAARGIGASIAVRMADDGHDVAVLDLDLANCAATVAAIKKLGRRAIGVGANVADEKAVKIAVAVVAEELGPPTILVNNAGIIRDRSLAKMTLDEWDSVINVNLRGAFLMSREVQPHMRAAEWGRIINLSSIAALGNVGEANYSAAKAGVQGFTKSLALELGRYGITANAVAPGFVEVSKASRNVKPVKSPVRCFTLTGLMSSQILYGAVGGFASIGDTLQTCLRRSVPAVDLIICRSLRLLTHWQTPTPIYLTMRPPRSCPLSIETI